MVNGDKLRSILLFGNSLGRNKVKSLESRLHEAVTHAMDGGVHKLHLGLPVHSPGIRHMENDKIYKYGSQNWKDCKISRNQIPKNLRYQSNKNV